MVGKPIKQSKTRQQFSKGEDITDSRDFESKVNNTPIDETSLDEIFTQEAQTQGDNVKELFGEKNVKARTDLSPKQISNIARAYYLAKMCKMPEIKTLLDEFITLRISKDRKSRSEFVEGLKAKIDNGIASAGQMLRGQFK